MGWSVCCRKQCGPTRSGSVVESLRGALDYLLAQPDIDPARVAYVGHDFGMMYGLLLSKTDKRPCVWALQAGLDAFQDWY